LSTILKQPVTGPSAWTAKDYIDDTSYIHHLTEQDLAGIKAGLAQLKVHGKKFPHFGQQDFPLQHLATKLTQLVDDLENGRGFFLLRGLPLEQFTQEQQHTIYYGIGLHLGIPVAQNPRGDILGAVENVGDPNDKQTRVYETNLFLPYHTDPSDVVGLLSLRKAKQGGLSSLVSSAAIYNQILSEYPEYLGLYYKTYYYAHLGKQRPTPSPLFSYHKGKLSCRYLRQYIELGHEMLEHPLSQVELKALDIFDEIMLRDEMRLNMMLEPGDMQFANNYLVLHSRNSFEDHEDVNQRRKLLRLWLKMPNARELAPEFPGRNGFPLKL
tara:strand:- start:3061 stop:4035 length:975 start_codon:yes stop_codon:yes gene_type:complete